MCCQGKSLERPFFTSWISVAKYCKFFLSVSILMKNLQYLATEIDKVKNGLCPKIMKEVFVFQENEKYYLRSGTHLANRNMHTAHFGIDTITNLGPKLCKLILNSVKDFIKVLVFLKSVQIFNGIHK